MSKRIVWAVVAAWGAAVVGCGAEGALLTRRDAEPPGAHCQRGGVALRSGTDDNGDGVLDDAEVERVAYVCDGPAVLTRKRPLAPSLECPAGGLAVQMGHDNNDNGALDDAEVEHATRVCDSTELWEGDFGYSDWSDPVKVAALRGARVVAGSLAFGAEPATLPLLEEVAGDLSTYSYSSPGAPAVRVELPALRWVGGNASLAASVDVYAPALAEVGGGLGMWGGALPALVTVGGNLGIGGGALPALATVGGRFAIVSNASGISAPVLRSVGGDLDLTYNARGELALPGLERIGGALVVQGPITGLRLDRLASIGGGLHVDASSQPQFPLALPALQSIGGDLDSQYTGLTRIELPQLVRVSGKLRIYYNQALTRVALPQVTEIGGELSLDSVPALTAVDLRRLATVGDVAIRGAPVLAAIDLGRLATAGAIRISGTRVTALALGGLVTAGHIYIDAIPTLTAVDLGGLEEAGGLWLLDTPALTTLSLTALTRVGPSPYGTAILIRNASLAAIGWPSLREVRGDLSLESLPALQRVELPQLTTSRSLELYGSHAVTVVTAPLLANGFVDPPDIYIDSPVQLLDLGALVTARDITLEHLALADLSGLHSLRGAATLRVRYATALHDLRGLASLALVTSLDLYGNALTSLDGLERLTSIRGEVSVVYNQALTSTAGLRNVTAIGATLKVAVSPALNDLGLTGLASIGGSLDLEFLGALTSLSGLSALTSVIGYVDVYYTGVPQAEIDAFRARLHR